MPIRFRCSHCSRLLGIARRKAGTQVRCPECSESIIVPIQDDPGGLDELDDLLNSHPRANGQPAEANLPIANYSAPAMDVAEPESARPVAPAPAPRQPSTPRKAAPEPAPVRPGRGRKAGDDEPLLLEDVDELLGVNRAGERLELDDEPPKVKPVSGMDANSLDSHPGKVVLSPQKATLLMIAVVILVGLAFTAGFLIGSRL
jgi:DNA-directed RNA polymerase subunit RPC12/RpoP